MAIAKRIHAKLIGGRSSSPILMASQVEPQMRHRVTHTAALSDVTGRSSLGQSTYAMLGRLLAVVAVLALGLSAREVAAQDVNRVSEALLTEVMPAADR